jgi:ABC-2 type transport system ATP-binding protein
MDAMIDVKNLVRRFGPFTAVDGVSFGVGKGEVVGFLGPNGAGKSTTMKMITGFLTPTSGSISVGGHDVQAAPIAAKRVLGYLPEGAPAYPDMTPRQFLSFIADIRRMAGPERKRRMEQVVEQVHITEVLDQPIDTLSKGFKRRVGLAQAILHDPPILVLDEPTDGLDPNQKHEVRNLIGTMAADKAIIISTHILEEVEAICTRAMVIARGRLVAEGWPESDHWMLGGLRVEPGRLDAAFRQLTGKTSVQEAA